LTAYETAIERVCERHSATVVCLYAMSLSEAHLALGLHAHAHVCTAHGVRANPHYVPMAVLKRNDPREHLTHWLNCLDGEAPAQAARRGRVNDSYHVQSFAPLIAADGHAGPWDIRCFGSLTVRRADGASVKWDECDGATSKVKALFAFLLVRGDRGATAAEIADLLWPEASDSKQSLNRLYHTVRCLRVALDPDQADSRHSAYVRHDDQRYFLAAPSVSLIDVAEFQDSCYRGVNHLQNFRLDAALAAFQAAEQLYTGDLFADVPAKYAENNDHDWCMSRRYWLRDMHLKLLCSTASVLRQQGRLADAQAYCDKALKSDPLSESAHGEKMRVFAAAQREDALRRQYRSLCKALAACDLGAPSVPTTQLYTLLQNSLKLKAT
jgi:two-component SAPR family response regulator